MAQSFRTFVVASVLALVTSGLVTGREADANRAKRGASAKREASTSRVNEGELTKLMDVYRFGMTKAQVFTEIETQIKARYDKQIFATSDVYQQDKLRRERDQEIERIKSSFVEFQGTVTGWDVSLIDDQFAHNTGESMLVSWEEIGGRNQRRFFFFHEGRLYKMVLALDTTNIDDALRNFDSFKQLMQRRFGPARDIDGGLFWSTKKYFLVALNKLTHYDTLCLAISDPEANRRLMQLRAQHKPKVEKRSPIIRAMIENAD
jgi:hypothetical protein